MGGIGHAGCFSFYPGKNLGAYGESGAIVTNDYEMAKKIRMLRDWGTGGKYDHDDPGYNYRMEALQGAVLRVKLPYLDHWNEARRKWANFYEMELKNYSIRTLANPDWSKSVHHIFPVLVEKRDN